MSSSCGGFEGAFFAGEGASPVGPAFQYAISTADSAVPAVTQGIAVPIGGGNVDGADTDLLIGIAQELQYLIVGIANLGTSGENNSALVDILINTGGGYTELVSDLAAGFVAAQNNTQGVTNWYHFPLLVPAGATLGARGRKSGATGVTARVLCIGFGQPLYAGQWWYGTQVETLGAVPVSSAGTPVVPGAGAFGAFADIGVSTRRYRAVQYGVQPNVAAATALNYLFQLGVGGAKMPEVPTIGMAITNTEVGVRQYQGMPFFIDHPAGTTFQVSGQCNAAPDAVTACVHGVS